MRNPSVQLYSVRDQFGDDAAATLRRIAEIGFRQVEPYGLVDHRPALEKALPAQQLTAPTAHVKLVGADLPEVFDAATACGVNVVIEPAVRDGVPALRAGRLPAPTTRRGVMVGGFG